jgi:elongation factor Ts
LQVASLPVKDTEDLLKQDFIKDPSKKISDLVTELIAKVGENIKVGRVVRMELGEEK